VTNHGNNDHASNTRNSFRLPAFYIQTVLTWSLKVGAAVVVCTEKKTRHTEEKLNTTMVVDFMRIVEQRKRTELDGRKKT
jgi:hypothetical protein